MGNRGRLINKFHGSVRQEVYEFVVYYWKHNQMAPSIRDIIDGTHVTSTSVVNYYLGQLEAHDRLIEKSGGGRSRGIRVRGSRWLSPEEVLEYNRVLSKQDNRSEPDDRERRLHNPEAPQKIING